MVGRDRPGNGDRHVAKHYRQVDGRAPTAVAVRDLDGPGRIASRAQAGQCGVPVSGTSRRTRTSRSAFGLSIVKPCFSMVSTKSMVAPLQVGDAHPVDDDVDAVEVLDDVAVELALVEEQLVAQTGAAAGLHGDAQREVVATLLVEQRLDLRGRGVGDEDAARAGPCSCFACVVSSWMVISAAPSVGRGARRDALRDAVLSADSTQFACVPW